MWYLQLKFSCPHNVIHNFHLSLYTQLATSESPKKQANKYVIQMSV